MQGHAAVIELLNDVLTAELTAVSEDFLDAKNATSGSARGSGDES